MASPQRKQPVTGRTRTFVITVDRFIYWLSRHWLAVFNILVALYVGLPMLAPVLMNAGYQRPAQTIYTIYSPLCHQMASRSFFLFGEQYAYPRPIANTDLTPLDAYISTIPEFAGVDPTNFSAYTLAARNFVGNEQLGYKMALCERDIGIYFFVLIGGLLYALLRKRIHIPPLSIVLFIIFGMIPIGLDGFSQLFGYMFTLFDSSTSTGIVGTLQRFFPVRESTPFLRLFTGALFGLMLAWLAYPRIAEGMAATEQELEKKLRRIGVIS